VHRLDQLPFEFRIAFGLSGEEQMAPLTSSVEGSPDQVAGERGGRDGVGYEADCVSGAGAEAA